MKCNNCGKEFENEVIFCPECGERVAENNSEESQKETVVESTPSKITSPYTDGENTSAVKHKKRLKLSKKLIKPLIFGVLCVVVIVIISAIVGAIASLGEYDADKVPVIYTTDSEVKYIRSGEKQGMVLASEEDFYEINSHTVQITEDGEYIFFLTENKLGGFDLNVRKADDKSEEANKIVATEIDSYSISHDGKTVFYLKGGDLYRVGRNGKKPVKMGNNVGGFTMSDDYKNVIYTNYDGEWYFSKGVDKVHIKVADAEVEQVRFMNGCKNVAIIVPEKNGFALYICGTGKKSVPEKVESAIEDFVYPPDSEEIHFIRKGKLFVKNGTGKSKEIDGGGAKFSVFTTAVGEDGTRIIYAIAERTVDGDTKYDFYHVGEDKASLVIEDIKEKYYFGAAKLVGVSEYDYEAFEELKEFYLRVADDKYVKTEVPREDGRTVEYKYTQNNLYTLEHVDEENGMGELVKYEFTEKGVDIENGVVIAEDVIGFDVAYTDICDKEMIVIMHDSNDFSLYTGGKKAVSIPADVHFFNGAYTDGTMIMEIDYSRYRESYSLAKFNGKKVVSFAEGVVAYNVIDENSFFYINEDGQLVYNKGKLGKDTVIDEGVTSIETPNAFIVSKDGIDEDYRKHYLYFH